MTDHLSIGEKVTPYQAMRHAIRWALRGFPEVMDNPAVGCVIVDQDHRLLASGFHKKSGSDHAEINALKKISSREKLNGATVYVTLEPCAFAGRTGSCAQELAQWPVKAVIIGCIDPHEKVQGAGVDILRKAGKTARMFSDMTQAERGGGDLKEPLARLIEVFEYNQLQKKAFISLKVATSLDGQMALSNGDSRWISGEQSRQYVHRLRHRHQGILVGVDTFLFDNPRLNIRGYDRPESSQKVFVLDRQLRGADSLAKSELIRCHSKENIFWVVSSQLSERNEIVAEMAKIEKHAQLLHCADLGDEIDLQDLKEKMLKLGAYSVLLEGGAKTHASFLRQKAANRVFQFIAPVILGDGGAKTWTESFSIENMEERLSLKAPVTKNFGQDVLVTGRVL